MSRQNFYKQRQIRRVRSIPTGKILDLVCRERCIQPRLGTRKLLKVLSEDLAAAGVSIGRDRLFTLLRAHHLLIRRRRRYARTTDSRHGLPVYPNRLREAVLTGPHQAWVSDITYLRTRQGFVYLSLVMDAYSRKIVGYHSSDRLESEGVSSPDLKLSPWFLNSGFRILDLFCPFDFFLLSNFDFLISRRFLDRRCRNQSVYATGGGGFGRTF